MPKRAMKLIYKSKEKLPQTGREYFPVIDPQGNVIRYEERSVCHNGCKLLHPVVHLHVFDEKGRLFLQKRSDSKDIQPGKWDTSVGGHIDYGENVEDALQRESSEELGIKLIDPQYLYHYIFESDIEKEFVFTYKTILHNLAITVDPGEISEGRFWEIKEIKDNIGKDIFTPNFELEFSRLLPLI